MLNILGIATSNAEILSITSFCFFVIAITSVILSVLNGFKFNQWYYQDVISNRGKPRSKKNFWILLVSEIILIIVLTSLYYKAIDPHPESKPDLEHDNSINTQIDSDLTQKEITKSSARVNNEDDIRNKFNVWLESHPFDEYTFIEPNARDDGWGFTMWVGDTEVLCGGIDRETGTLYADLEQTRTLDDWYAIEYLGILPEEYQFRDQEDICTQDSKRDASLCGRWRSHDGSYLILKNDKFYRNRLCKLSIIC